MSEFPLLLLSGAFLSSRAVAVAAAALALLALGRIGRALAARASADTHVRGTRVTVSAAPYGCGMRRFAAPRAASPAGSLRLGGLRVGSADETKHFKLIGTTGTGKSTAIAVLLRAAIARGDRAVIADPNGASLARFYDRYRGDVLLNPFEPSSAQWDPFGELRSGFDIENLARSLVPDGDDATGREWRGYARTLVSVVLRRTAESGRRDVTELWRLLAMAETQELRRVVAATAAQPFLDPDNARMFTSIRSVAVSSLAALPHLAACRGRRFAVREWIARGRGVLYMPYRADQIASLRALISAWMRLAIFETLSGAELPASIAKERSSEFWPGWARSAFARCEPGPHSRIWFIVDELDALGAIDGLTDALTRLRKFGGCCVLGVQSIGQVSSTYGVGPARSIIENCGNTLILRCSASDGGGTAAFASQLIGEREVLRRQTVRTRDRGELFARKSGRRATQITRQRITEAAVLPSEIEQLPDLRGYFKTASSPCWRLIRLAPEVRSWPSSTSG